MKLWLIEWTAFVGYDRRFAAVVRAKDEREAEFLLCQQVMPSMMFSAPKFTCYPLEQDGETGVLVAPGVNL